MQAFHDDATTRAIVVTGSEKAFAGTAKEEWLVLAMVTDL